MFTLHLISDEDDLCRMELDEEALATFLRYAKETADGVLEDDPGNLLNLSVKSTAVGLTKFLLDPWSYSNQPKCITCNRVLSAEEWDDTGQCQFCQMIDAEVITLADEQDDPDLPAMPDVYWPTNT